MQKARTSVAAWRRLPQASSVMAHATWSWSGVDRRSNGGCAKKQAGPSMHAEGAKGACTARWRVSVAQTPTPPDLDSSHLGWKLYLFWV